MKAGWRKFWKILIVAATIVVICLIAFLIWLYTGSTNKTQQKLLDKFNLPAAAVNGSYIPFRTVELRSSLWQIYANNNTLGSGGSPNTQAILQQLIAEEKTKELASSEGVFVSQQELDNAYANMAGDPDDQSLGNIFGILASNGLSETVFKNELLRPELLDTYLQIWFNSQSSLNQPAYQQSGTITSDIKNGQDFSSLASVYTQDQTGKETGGDLGFINPINLLPELREPVDNMKVGDDTVIPSRYGLNIFKLAGKSGNLLHLYQIFLQTSDFSSWYNSKTKNYLVLRLIKT